MTLHALDKRFRIMELPVEYTDRPAGSVSKLHTLSDGLRVLSTIVQILRYYCPLAFFDAFTLLAYMGTKPFSHQFCEVKNGLRTPSNDGRNDFRGSLVLRVKTKFKRACIRESVVKSRLEWYV
ncbi:MAG: hypothetical protein PGN26_03700 [Xylophilus ampelinus]